MTPQEVKAAADSLRTVGGVYEYVADCVEYDNRPADPPLTETDLDALARMGLPRTSLDLPKENTTMKISKRITRLRSSARGGSFIHRLASVAAVRHPWYDWGHLVMLLVGVWRHGDYGPPRGRDLWYRQVGRRAFKTTYDYQDVRALPNGEWKIFDIQNDGYELVLGWYGDRVSPSSLERPELRLFRRWDFWECRVRGEWFGLRRWLYYRALHAAVHLKKPFACNLTPPRGSGGYDHWYCELRGRHDMHRFRNYTWAADRVTFDPKPVSQAGSGR